MCQKIGETNSKYHLMLWENQKQVYSFDQVYSTFTLKKQKGSPGKSKCREWSYKNRRSKSVIVDSLKKKMVKEKCEE